MHVGRQERRRGLVNGHEFFGVAVWDLQQLEGSACNVAVAVREAERAGEEDRVAASVEHGAVVEARVVPVQKQDRGEIVGRYLQRDCRERR